MHRRARRAWWTRPPIKLVVGRTTYTVDSRGMLTWLRNVADRMRAERESKISSPAFCASCSAHRPPPIRMLTEWSSGSSTVFRSCSWVGPPNYTPEFLACAVQFADKNVIFSTGDADDAYMAVDSTGKQCAIPTCCTDGKKTWWEGMP